MLGLKVLSKVYGFRYNTLASQIPCSSSLISLWVSGKRKIDKSYVRRISQILEVDEKYIDNDLNKIDELEIIKHKITNDFAKVGKANYENDIIKNYEDLNKTLQLLDNQIQEEKLSNRNKYLKKQICDLIDSLDSQDSETM